MVWVRLIMDPPEDMMHRSSVLGRSIELFVVLWHIISTVANGTAKASIPLDTAW